MRKIFLFFLLFCPVTLQAQQTESFKWFFKEFCYNQTFQKERVKFPLRHVFLDDDFNLDSAFIEQKTYQPVKLLYVLEEEMESYPMLYDNKDCKLDDSGYRVFQWKGFYAEDERFHFQRIDRRWYLIRVESLGT